MLPNAVYNNQFIYTQGGAGLIADPAKLKDPQQRSASLPRFIANNAVHEYLSQASVTENIGPQQFNAVSKASASLSVATAELEVARRGLVASVVGLFYASSICRPPDRGGRARRQRGGQPHHPHPAARDGPRGRPRRRRQGAASAAAARPRPDGCAPGGRPRPPRPCRAALSRSAHALHAGRARSAPGARARRCGGRAGQAQSGTGQRAGQLASGRPECHLRPPGLPARSLPQLLLWHRRRAVRAIQPAWRPQPRLLRQRHAEHPAMGLVRHPRPHSPERDQPRFGAHRPHQHPAQTDRRPGRVLCRSRGRARSARKPGPQRNHGGGGPSPDAAQLLRRRNADSRSGRCGELADRRRTCARGRQSSATRPLSRTFSC